MSDTIPESVAPTASVVPPAQAKPIQRRKRGPNKRPYPLKGVSKADVAAGVRAPAPASEAPKIVAPSLKDIADLKLNRVGTSNVIEIGLEGLSAFQTLGDFDFPQEFDKVNFTGAYGCEEAGTVGAFRSVADLCQPQRHPAIRMVHPGWRVWYGANGQKHQIKKEKGTLTLLYADRKDNDVINAAYGNLARTQAKSTEAKIALTNVGLPIEDQLQQAREEDQIRDAITHFEMSGAR